VDERLAKGVPASPSRNHGRKGIEVEEAAAAPGSAGALWL